MIRNIKSNFLDEAITTLVRKYMDIGYILNTETMTGSDGTKRVDLRRGKDFIRVWADRMSAWSYKKSLDEDYDYYRDVFLLRIGRTTLTNLNTNIVWSNKLEVIYERPYYEIGNCKPAYTDNFDDVRHYLEVSSPRRKAQWDNEHNNYTTYTDNKRLAVGLNIVKRVPKTKTLNINNIDSVTRDNNRLEYTVYYHTNNGVKRHVTVTPKEKY